MKPSNVRGADRVLRGRLIKTRAVGEGAGNRGLRYQSHRGRSKRKERTWCGGRSLEVKEDKEGTGLTWQEQEASCRREVRTLRKRIPLLGVL